MPLTTGVYIGWVGRDNLGDEAMWQVCQARFPEIAWVPVDDPLHQWDAAAFARKVLRAPRHLLHTVGDELVHQRRFRGLLRAAGRARPRHVGVGLLGGGTLINDGGKWLADYRLVKRQSARPVFVFGTGVAPPEWLDHIGLRDRRPEWAAVLRDLPFVGVRGPLSQRLLQEAGTDRVVVSGDPAVLFHRHQATAAEPSPPSIRIGISYGHSPSGLWGRQGDLDRSLVALVRRLRFAGATVVVLPLRSQDLPACRRLIEGAGLDPSTLVSPPATPEAFLAAVQDLTALVTFRLHAAILAAAATVPFVMLEYHPKCADFAASLGWEAFTIRTDQASTAALLALLDRLLADRASYRRYLCVRMCALAATFRTYCDALEDHLYP
jgi:polysaccharide pyruvyl transferase WcaK-like protein